MYDVDFSFAFRFLLDFQVDGRLALRLFSILLSGGASLVIEVLVDYWKLTYPYAGPNLTQSYSSLSFDRGHYASRGFRLYTSFQKLYLFFYKKNSAFLERKDLGNNCQ